MSLDLYCGCDTYSYPFHSKVVKARKEHACMECSRKIKPGEHYQSVGGLCEGEWWDGKICARCQGLLDYVKGFIPCVCVSYGNMHEELTEICREASHEATGLLFGLYRRMSPNFRFSSTEAYKK